MVDVGVGRLSNVFAVTVVLAKLVVTSMSPPSVYTTALLATPCVAPDPANNCIVPSEGPNLLALLAFP